MIALDTNVLVRFLVQDDAEQGERATAFMSRRTPEEPAFVSLVVLVETVWVLRRTFRYPARAVRNVVRSLLDVSELVIQNSSLARAALDQCDRSGADFADAVIHLLAREAGCSETVTFDQHAAKTLGMRLL
ncbi:PIN domain-containing protein [Spongisporangium articulatum]|uniref:PIN domain-containing protein n=1 Tax=Spongisporangium articulatum TaxID=3362603 RepID=A0ABW8AS21_9ACTN